MREILDGPRVIAEYDGSENFKMAYVYGNYVDEVLYKKAPSPLATQSARLPVVCLEFWA